VQELWQAWHQKRVIRITSTLATEVTIPITVVLAPKSTRPPVNLKNRTKEDHVKDHCRSSRHYKERSSSSKSPRRGRVTGGSSSTDLDFLGHDLQVVEGVPYE